MIGMRRRIDAALAECARLREAYATTRPVRHVLNAIERALKGGDDD